MANQPALGLFGQLGFPTLSQGDLLKQRAATETRLFGELVKDYASAMPAGEQSIFRAFANIGRAVAGKPEAELTDREAQQFAIINRTNAKVKELKNDPSFQGLSARDKALRTQEAMAQAALEAGDVQTFSQISLRTAQQRQAFRQADAELENLDATTEGTRARTGQTRKQTDLLDFKLDTARHGAPGTYAVAGPNGFDFSLQPELVSGQVDPSTGVLTTTDGRRIENYITPEDYDRFQKNLISAAGAAGRRRGSSAGDSASKSFLSNFGSSERRKTRDAANDFTQVGAAIKSVAGAISRQEAAGGAGESVVGTAGRIIRLGGSLAGTAKGLAVVFGGNDRGDGTVEGGTSRSLSEATELFGQEINVPPDFRGTEQEASRYRSAIMQLVYLDARLAEPGARQLSDADIRNAMDRLGVSSNSPEAIARTLIQNYEERAGSMRGRIRQVRGVAKAHGLAPERGERLIFGTDTLMKEIDESVERIAEAFGLTRPDEETGAITPAAAERPQEIPEGVQFISVDADGNPIQP